MRSLKWIFACGFLVIAIIVAVGVFVRTDLWRWDIFLGFTAVSSSLLFVSWSLTHQMRINRKQAVLGDYGLLLSMCKCMGIQDYSAEKYLEDLHTAAKTLDQAKIDSLYDVGFGRLATLELKPETKRNYIVLRPIDKIVIGTGFLAGTGLLISGVVLNYGFLSWMGVICLVVGFIHIMTSMR